MPIWTNTGNVISHVVVQCLYYEYYVCPILLQKHTYHHDDAVQVKNIELVSKICKLLDVSTPYHIVHCTQLTVNLFLDVNWVCVGSVRMRMWCDSKSYQMFFDRSKGNWMKTTTLLMSLQMACTSLEHAGRYFIIICCPALRIWLLLFCFILCWWWTSLCLEYPQVKEESFLEALTSKRTIAGGETMIVRYKLEDVSGFLF